MTFFKRGRKEKPPSYVLVERLPADTGPHILGRIVADFESPTDYFRPKKALEVLDKEELEITDSNYSSLFSIKKKQQHGAAKETNHQSKLIRTRILTQHKDVLARLLISDREGIIELLRDSKQNKGYMVVGFKTALDSDSVSSRQYSYTTSVGAEFPTNLITTAATHGAVNIGKVADPAVQTAKSAEESGETKFHMDGEQIFAIRYRIISLRKKRGLEYVDYGDVKRVNVEDGVYGKEEPEPVFDEDEFNDGDEFTDSQFCLLNDSMKSEAKRVGSDVIVARFEL